MSHVLLGLRYCAVIVIAMVYINGVLIMTVILRSHRVNVKVSLAKVAQKHGLLEAIPLIHRYVLSCTFLSCIMLNR